MASFSPNNNDDDDDDSRKGKAPGSGSPSSDKAFDKVAAALMTKKKKQAAGAASHRECAECGAPEGTVPTMILHLSCNKCKITFYCSRACQASHWKTGGHKEHCVTPEQRSRAAQEKAAAAVAKSNKSKAGAAAAEEAECPICLELLSVNLPVQTLPCSHIFHVACVARLRSFSIQQVCPSCRAELPPGPEQVYEDAVRR